MVKSQTQRIRKYSSTILNLKGKVNTGADQLQEAPEGAVTVNKN